MTKTCKLFSIALVETNKLNKKYIDAAINQVGFDPYVITDPEWLQIILNQNILLQLIGRFEFGLQNTNKHRFDFHISLRKHIDSYSNYVWLSNQLPKKGSYLPLLYKNVTAIFKYCNKQL